MEENVMNNLNELPGTAALLAVLALLALLLPILCRKLIHYVMQHLGLHFPEWLKILVTSYERPVALMVRSYLVMLVLFFLPLPFNTDGYKTFLSLLFHLAVIFLVGWGAWRAAPVCQLLLRSAGNRLDFTTGRTMTGFFENIYRFLVVLFTGIALLDRLGVPVTGLLTGAGVAGLAVSLAAQSTLSNLIAGITLVAEHPFAIGDYVVLNGYEGTVQDVSFRSTKLCTPDHVVITVENSKVCAEYIQNVTNRTSRLWESTIGVTYDTPRTKVEELCAALTTLLQGDSKVQADTVLVTLAAFGASSIDIQLRAYVTTLPIAEYLAWKNHINLEIMETVQQLGCSFAFPTTTVEFANTPPQG